MNLDQNSTRLTLCAAGFYQLGNELRPEQDEDKPDELTRFYQLGNELRPELGAFFTSLTD